MSKKPIHNFKDLEESKLSPNFFTNLSLNLLNNWNGIKELEKIYYELEDTFIKNLEDSREWDYYYQFKQSLDFTFIETRNYLLLEFCSVVRCFNEKLHDLLFIKENNWEENKRYTTITEWIKTTKFLNFLIDNRGDIQNTLSFVLHNKDKLDFDISKINNSHPYIWNSFSDLFELIDINDLKQELEILLNKFADIDYSENKIGKSLEITPKFIFEFWKTLVNSTLHKKAKLNKNDEDLFDLTTNCVYPQKIYPVIGTDVKVEIIFDQNKFKTIAQEYQSFSFNSRNLIVTIGGHTELFKLTNSDDDWAIKMKKLRKKIDRNQKGPDKTPDKIKKGEQKIIRKFLKENFNNITSCWQKYTSNSSDYELYGWKPNFILTIVFANENRAFNIYKSFFDNITLQPNEGLLYVETNKEIKVYKVNKTFRYPSWYNKDYFFKFRYWCNLINKLKCEYLMPWENKYNKLESFLNKKCKGVICIRTINK